MATMADKRNWLADNGHPELRGGQGRIAAALLAEYDTAHQDPPPDPGAPADDFGPGAGPGDFVAADDPDSYPGDPGADVAAYDDPGAAGPGAVEDRPGRPSRAKWRLPWQRGPREPKPPRAPRQGGRRVSIAPLIEDTYSDLAWAARGIPPLQRLLYAQAPVAGVILDPVAKGTVVDRVLLQPAARNYEAMKVFLALVGTPATLMGVLATAPQPVFEDGQVAWEAVTDEDGKPVPGPDGEPLMAMRMTPVTPAHMGALIGFRYCVRAMADLSGDALKRVQARAESNAARDDLVDGFMAYILGTVVPTDRAETARQEGAGEGLRLAGADGAGPQ